MSSKVKDLIAQLDAAKLQAEAEARAREQAAIEAQVQREREDAERRQRQGDYGIPCLEFKCASLNESFP